MQRQGCIEVELDMEQNMDLNDFGITKENNVGINKESEMHGTSSNQDKDDSLEIAAVETKLSHEKTDTLKLEEKDSITSVKSCAGSKLKAKKEGDSEEIELMVKGRRGKKRKQDTLEAPSEVTEESKPKAKRAKNSNTLTSKRSKKPNSNLSNLQLLSPPPTPPPPTEAEIAEAAAKATAESARKERLKLIPYYYEEMKEIFDYLCDRGVYWKNDLPKNKKYSNRDTKLLEKEVKKKALEILERYPKEKEVMKAFEEEEQKLKVLGERQEQGDSNEKETDIDAKGEPAILD
ncbi:uncharacterized protein DFL_006428 [Arthrobotrys flagrans]|uniref:Uncharacterized protein n=1 Tax=Arthrobotrys flagrans TaxID=97331 RepID=A0A437A0R2_ARTFL|nr:hypothetical protein DFL_006428 [Arthrobotrys flagrans]